MFVPSIKKWLDTSQPFNPGLTKFLEALLPSKSRVIEELDDKSSPLNINESPQPLENNDTTLLTEQDLEALLFGNNVNTVL